MVIYRRWTSQDSHGSHLHVGPMSSWMKARHFWKSWNPHLNKPSLQNDTWHEHSTTLPDWDSIFTRLFGRDHVFILSFFHMSQIRQFWGVIYPHTSPKLDGVHAKTQRPQPFLFSFFCPTTFSVPFCPVFRGQVGWGWRDQGSSGFFSNATCGCPCVNKKKQQKHM